jgi:hypothetical protein
MAPAYSDSIDFATHRTAPHRTDPEPFDAQTAFAF